MTIIHWPKVCALAGIIILSGCTMIQAARSIPTAMPVLPPLVAPSPVDAQTPTARPLPEFYTVPVSPVADLNTLMNSGESIMFHVPVRNENWSRPTEADQRAEVWSKKPFEDLPENFLRWWFTQSAVLYDSLDILSSSSEDEYDLSAPRSDWRALTGTWPTWSSSFGSWQDYESGDFAPLSSQDYLEGKTIEVWLMSYTAVDVIRAEDHYFIQVSAKPGFEIIRFADPGPGAFQIHIVDGDTGQEITRLPILCNSPEQPECNQPGQLNLAFFPSPSPTLLSYTPEPTPDFPSIDKLATINRTNLPQLQLIGRYEPEHNLEPGDFPRFAISPDGKTLAFTENKNILLWDIEAQNVTRSMVLPENEEYQRYSEVYELAFRSDGKMLATLSGDGPRMWDVSSGRLLWHGELPEGAVEGFSAMAFSPDGSFLVTVSVGADSDVRLWSTQTGQVLRTLGKWNQMDVAFSPDGEQMFTVDRFDEGILLWDTSTWEIIDRYLVGWSPTPHKIRITPNGLLIAVNFSFLSASINLTCLYQIDGWKHLGCTDEVDLLKFYDTDRTEPGFNADGGIVIFADAEEEDYNAPITTVKFWDSLTQQSLLTLHPSLPTSIQQAEFSPDGKLLVIRAENGTAVFWGVLEP